MLLVQKLHATDDAEVWAEEFLNVVAHGAVVDRDLMIAWFANAIEVGKAHAKPTMP